MKPLLLPASIRLDFAHQKLLWPQRTSPVPGPNVTLLPHNILGSEDTGNSLLLLMRSAVGVLTLLPHFLKTSFSISTMRDIACGLIVFPKMKGERLNRWGAHVDV